MKKNYLFTDTSLRNQITFLGGVLAGVILSICVAATPGKPTVKPSPADQRILSKSYRVACLDCNENGDTKYRLKPTKVTSTGSRSVPNGYAREITLHFKCPVRHEFSAPGPEVFVPAIRAEEEK